MAGNMVALRQSLHVVLKRPEANPSVAPRAFVGDGAGESAPNRVKAGDTALYEIIMRRYYQRLYRVARAILSDDAKAQDVMQDAYVRAYQHLDQFAGLAPFSAWLTSIAVHEALARLRSRKRNPQLDDNDPDGELSMNMVETSPGPRAKSYKSGARTASRRSTA
jgi:RNA polymerase sigma-70 factor (ECF subfamily)